MHGENDLLEHLAEDPSPYADLQLILAAAKANGRPFEGAWAQAMRAMQPPRNLSPDAALEARTFRLVLREVRCDFRAAYEDRPLTEEERSARDELADRRVDKLLGKTRSRAVAA